MVEQVASPALYGFNSVPLAGSGWTSIPAKVAAGCTVCFVLRFDEEKMRVISDKISLLCNHQPSNSALNRPKDQGTQFFGAAAISAGVIVV
jgi:hypothetical protein